MEQSALYTMVTNAGFSVLVFEDHPKFFGNWRVMVERNQCVYEISCDNRDGWLLLLQHEQGKMNKLFETESSRLGQKEQLAQVSTWLHEITQ